jgi:hypothetical protein
VAPPRNGEFERGRGTLAGLAEQSKEIDSEVIASATDLLQPRQTIQ